MFTGIIQEIGTVASTPSGKLVIGAEQVIEGLELGGSVCVNGACQTVIAFDDSSFTVEVMPETLRRTNLGQLQRGDRVNLERPLGLGGELGGHLVQGHVDDTGKIVSAVKEGRVYVVNQDLVERPGPRIVDGLEELFRLVYQEEEKRDTGENH